MPAQLVVIVPVLMRPWRVRPFLDSLRAATPEPHRVLFVGTRTDRAMNQMIEQVAGDDDTVQLELLGPNRIGDYARKINYGYSISTEPFLFLAADDLAFHPGWFGAAMARMTRRVGVVGTQDLAPTERARAGLHATHSLVRRSYIDAHGTIDEDRKVLHEGYVHEYVDDEFIGTAKHRKAFAFAHDSVVEHLHPSWGKAKRDKLYQQQGMRMRAGRVLFEQRRHLWEQTTSP